VVDAMANSSLSRVRLDLDSVVVVPRLCSRESFDRPCPGDVIFSCPWSWSWSWERWRFDTESRLLYALIYGSSENVITRSLDIQADIERLNGSR